MKYLDNLDMRNEEIVREEVAKFKISGGGTIVDVTPHMGDSRNPQLLKRISEATGVNIVMGCSWYVAAAHPLEIEFLSEFELCELIVRDITHGANDTEIRSGIIGEVGTGDPLLSSEIKVLRASTRAHLITGCPMNIHMAAGCHQVMPVLDIIESEGVKDLSKVVISHMDVKLDLSQQREVIARGAIVEYDTFGHEHYPDSRGFRMPSDTDRIDGISTLASEGLLSSILVSHDVCLKHLWSKYGGRGYIPLITDLQSVFKSRGFDNSELQRLLVANPRKLLSFI